MKYQIGLYGIEKCHLETPDTLVKNNAYMLGAYSEGSLIGIGAVKVLGAYGEIKRMYVKEQCRGLSIATRILRELEARVQRRGISSIYLETGHLHHAAIHFYKRKGYQQVDSFGDYSANPVSIYFAKHLK